MRVTACLNGNLDGLRRPIADKLCAEVGELRRFVLFDGVTFLEIPPHGRHAIASGKAVPVPLILLMNAIDKLQIAIGAVVFSSGTRINLHTLEIWSTIRETFH